MKISNLVKFSFLSLIVIIGSLLGGELLCAFFRPVSFVKTDILGRKIRDRQREEMKWFQHGNIPYHDLKPSSKGKTSLPSSYKYSWRINKLGLRGKEIGQKKHPRILVLGDSQTFGYAEENETYPAVLEEYFNAYSNTKIEVFNAGVSGYSTFECLWKLTRIITSVKPDLVVLTYYGSNNLVPSEGNDTYQNYLYLRNNKSPKTLEHRAVPAKAARNLRQTIAAHSHLYGLLAFLKREISGTQSYLDKVRAFRRGDNQPELSNVWYGIRDVINKIALLAETNQANFLIVYLPELCSLIDMDRSVEIELEKTPYPLITTFDVLLKAMADDPFRLRTFLDGHFNSMALTAIGRHVGKNIRELMHSHKISLQNN